MVTNTKYHFNLLKLIKNDIMDTIEELLAPDLLDVDPRTLTAEKQYSHWRRNFIYYIEDATTGSATPA